MVEARRELSEEEYVEGVLSGDRAVLGRAITLVESRIPEHQARAQRILHRLLPHGGRSHRVGITGVPGVGKSTLIEALGKRLTGAGHRVAVLAIDPTSQVSGGSLLGDKTRMEQLAADPRAFIRPSPSSGTLGGVARKTRETMLICEAAGFDIVLVETVGIGQSEMAVAEMVDFFLVLLLAGAGDALQAIKRGVLELADMLAVTKADGDNLPRAELAASEYRAALRLLRPPSPHWERPLLVLSAMSGEGLAELWEKVEAHREALTRSGEWEERRRRQQVRWMWSLLEERLLSQLRSHPEVEGILPAVEKEVEEGHLTPGLAAERILQAFGRAPRAEGGT